jgi:nicotinate phosphoribosyltransferase
MGRLVRYVVFTREDGIVVGANRAVNFIKENTYGPLKVWGLKDGEEFSSTIPVLIYEGEFAELVNLETTILGFLSYSGAATEMREIVKTADGVPVIDMSARHYPWQIIEETSLAAYLGGAAGTSTLAGYDYVQKWQKPGDKFKLFASLPHAMAAAVAELAEKENLFPSVMAAKLFHQTFPDKPIIVLVDYEGRELDVAAQAYEVFGEKLFAVRLDTHGERWHQGTTEFLSEMEAYFQEKTGRDSYDYFNPPSFHYWGKGVTVEAVFRMRDFLDSLGAKKVKIIVSSGFTAEKVMAFRQIEAPMDFIGTGSWVRFAMFTADITHVQESGEWRQRTKAGRTHKTADLPLLFERR